MIKIANLTKSIAVIIAGIIVLVAGAYFCSSGPRMKARQHFRILALGEMRSVRYECDGHRTLPAYYIGADDVDTACLQKIVDSLSLEKLDFFLYAGRNPPDWWPGEIAVRGSDDEVRRIGAALRANGDLVTYRFLQKIKDPSVGKRYHIDLYYFPRKKRLFYAKRWISVAVPALSRRNRLQGLVL